MVAPTCPVAASCGGCPLMGVKPEIARRIYEARLRKCLGEYLDHTYVDAPMRWVSRAQPEGYRRRIRLRVVPGAGLGFFNPNKYQGCPVLTPALRGALSALLASAESHRDSLDLLDYLELREPDIDGFASVWLVRRDPNRPMPVSALDALGAWLEPTLWAIAGESQPIAYQRLALPNVWQFVPIGSFLQVNHQINLQLVADIVAGATAKATRTFCDLYAGSGNFTLPLLNAGLRGRSLESDANAVLAAQHAAQLQQLHDGRFEIGDATTLASEIRSMSSAYDLVIVDPPRAGVRHQLESVAAIARHHLVYCSCNPATLARDLAVLRRARFEVESVTLYDMFTHTNHVEVLVWLRASTAGRLH